MNRFENVLNPAERCRIWRCMGLPYSQRRGVIAAVVDGRCCVGSNDDNVYAVNRKTGAMQWNFTTGALVQSAPVVGDGTVVRELFR